MSCDLATTGNLKDPFQKNFSFHNYGQESYTLQYNYCNDILDSLSVDVILDEDTVVNQFLGKRENFVLLCSYTVKQFSDKV